MNSTANCELFTSPSRLFSKRCFVFHEKMWNDFDESSYKPALLKMTLTETALTIFLIVSGLKPFIALFTLAIVDNLFSFNSQQVNPLLLLIIMKQVNLSIVFSIKITFFCNFFC